MTQGKTQPSEVPDRGGADATSGIARELTGIPSRDECACGEWLTDEQRRHDHERICNGGLRWVCGHCGAWGGNYHHDRACFMCHKQRCSCEVVPYKRGGLLLQHTRCPDHGAAGRWVIKAKGCAPKETPRPNAAQLAESAADATEAPPAELLKAARDLTEHGSPVALNRLASASSAPTPEVRPARWTADDYFTAACDERDKALTALAAAEAARDEARRIVAEVRNSLTWEWYARLCKALGVTDAGPV